MWAVNGSTLLIFKANSKSVSDTIRLCNPGRRSRGGFLDIFPILSIWAGCWWSPSAISIWSVWGKGAGGICPGTTCPGHTGRLYEKKGMEPTRECLPATYPILNVRWAWTVASCLSVIAYEWLSMRLFYVHVEKPSICMHVVNVTLPL